MSTGEKFRAAPFWWLLFTKRPTRTMTWEAPPCLKAWYSFLRRCTQGTRDLTRIEGANPFEFSLILYKITEISGCFIFFICGTKQFQNTYFAQVSPPKTSPSKNSEDKFQIQIFAQVSPPKTWPSKSFEDNFKSRFLPKSPPRRLVLQKVLKFKSHISPKPPPRRLHLQKVLKAISKHIFCPSLPPQDSTNFKSTFLPKSPPQNSIFKKTIPK